MKQNHLYSHTEIVIGDKTMEALTNIGNTFAKSNKITVYIDHYLNTITYHYTTYQPSGNTVLTGVSETGYVFQNRERLAQEVAGNLPPQLDNFLGKLKGILDITKQLSDKQLKDTEEKNKKEEAKKLDKLMNVPSIKLAYEDLEITNKKLIETAERLERFGKSHLNNKLNTFLNNTYYETEMNKLKTEYNKLARECLLQLTKLRLNIQSWVAKNPDYVKVVELALSGAKCGAIFVAGAGLITSFATTATISLPVALAGTGIVIAKGYTLNQIIDYCLNKMIECSEKQGTTIKEKEAFEMTAKWIADIIRNSKNISTMSSISNYNKIFNPQLTKTHIPKIDKSVEIASVLRGATKAHSKMQKQKLMEDVLKIITNE